jgi:hypothetical protein
MVIIEGLFMEVVFIIIQYPFNPLNPVVREKATPVQKLYFRSILYPLARHRMALQKAESQVRHNKPSHSRSTTLAGHTISIIEAM